METINAELIEAESLNRVSQGEPGISKATAP